jgi:hypothetical protein
MIFSRSAVDGADVINDGTGQRIISINPIKYVQNDVYLSV